MKYVIPAVIIVLALLGANGIYVVGEGHAAVLTRLGQVEASGIGPGLHFKLPFVEQVVVYDNRAIVMQSEPEDYQTSDGDAVRVGYFVRWRVADPQAYYAATKGDEVQATQAMTPAIRDALRTQVAKHDLADLLAADGGGIDQALDEAVAPAMRQKLGIAVLAVGVERVLPPDETLAAVFKRMTAEAKSRADGIRDKGKAAAAKVVAAGDSADREVLAGAAREAAEVRGQGDAQAAGVYAAASAKDPGFFRYWSSLDTWRKSFSSGDAVVVLDRDSPFMQAVDQGAANGGATPKR